MFDFVLFLDGTLDVFGSFVGMFCFVDVPSLGGVLRCSIVLVGVEARSFLLGRIVARGSGFSFSSCYWFLFCCDMLILPHFHSCCALLLRSPLEVDGRF